MTKKYFEATEFRAIREDLIFAVGKVQEPKVAIDCGCGAGADTNFLFSKGFEVHAFDIDDQAIDKCESRFSGFENINITKASFSNFDFPKASLVVADASLFFCASTEFKRVWESILKCLNSNGIFCGSFLGPEDTMAIPGENPSVFWSEVTVLEESEVKSLFVDFNILRFNVHRSTGKTPTGETHDWHIFQVVAQKSAKP